MKPKDPENTPPIKNPAIGHVHKINENIEKSVKNAASELKTVNEVLQQEEIPVHDMKQAITQNEAVEEKVAQAADDLTLINVKLAEEVSERIVMESELVDAKNDLAEARDDLSEARVKTKEAQEETKEAQEETKEAQEETKEAQQIALQDPLTGLPNRISFEQGLDRGLIQAKRHGWGLAVLFIDIDKFKTINDSYGHDVGDQVLLMVANRIKTLLRDEDMVSRWGGDEFACLLFEVKQEADVARLAETMIERIAETCELGGDSLTIRASIGIAIYPADGDSAGILFKNADTAMYEAKRSGKRVLLFRESGESKAGS